ncbi:MAG: hotdog fold thioesterase [Steroidobacteraceae bacterium]
MSIWHRTATPAELTATGSQSLPGYLGIVITEIGADFLRATMPVNAHTRQPFGLLHGGASVALAETLGSLGSMLCIDAGKFMAVGQEINANHVRGMAAGVVTASARPLHLGRTSHVWHIELRDEREQLVCVSRLTMAVIERRDKKTTRGVSA